MNKIKVLVYLVFFILALPGCKKNAPAINSTITGIVYDAHRQSPVPKAKVVISGYKNRFLSNTQFVGNADSAITGPDGKFSIAFSTLPNADIYKIVLHVNSPYIIFPPYLIIPFGKDTAVNFSVIKLFTLKAHVIVKNNTAPYVWVNASGGSGGKIYGVNKDTIVDMLVIPNQQNPISFGAQLPSESSPRYYTQIVGLNGFTNPYTVTFTIDPTTFPKSSYLSWAAMVGFASAK